MTKALSAALLFGSLAACTGTISGGGELDPNDHGPPTIEVLTPARGTVTGDGTITVTGRANDPESAIVQVTVNGTPASLAGDGSFEATVDLGEGITLIETIATDRGNNTISDARAVLSGTLVDQGVPIDDAIAAYISRQAMEGLGDLVGNFASGIDLTALAQSYNPVVNSGDSCNDYKAYVDSVQRGPIEVSAVPASGGIDADVSIRELVIRGRVTWEVLCVNGGTTYTITATAYDAGALIRPGLSSGDITIQLDGLTSGFRSFNLDVSGLPGFVEDRFENAVRDKVASILRDKIASIVPPLANQFLDGFVSKTYSLSLFGQTVDLAFWPSAMSWSDQGGSIVLDSNSSIASVEGVYLSTPSARPSDADMASTGLRLALADDVFNQLLAAIWSSGAIEDTLLPDQGDALGAALGADVDSATLTLSLPPVASFDTATGTARLTLGDVIVSAYGVDGSTLASFAISAHIDLAVTTGPSGNVKLITGTPQILGQVLEQSPGLLVPLDTLKVQAIAELAIKQFSASADDLLANIPVPGLANATIVSPTFQPVSGYLMMGGELEFE